jgi:hypothetical protein
VPIFGLLKSGQFGRHGQRSSWGGHSATGLFGPAIGGLRPRLGRFSTPGLLPLQALDSRLELGQLDLRFRQFLGGIRRSLPDRSATLRGTVIYEFFELQMAQKRQYDSLASSLSAPLDSKVHGRSDDDV